MQGRLIPSLLFYKIFDIIYLENVKRGRNMYITSYDEYVKKVEWLNKMTKEYDEGTPSVSDKAWDEVYFMVQDYETEYPEDISPESPTQKITFETVSELKKVKHNHPMLSLNKTKSVDDVLAWLHQRDYVVMAKMDGLTCSLQYEKGRLVRAETRGNGIEGEDITHNAMVIPSIPKRINTDEDIVVDGEIICTYEDFREFKEKYKNPRNFAAGSIRLLDSKECQKRHLTFIAWDLIKPNTYKTLIEKLERLDELNFDVVPFHVNSAIGGLHEKAYPQEVSDHIEDIKVCWGSDYPIDGVVFKFDKVSEYEAAGRTDHHFKGGLAYKFYDETYDTNLRDVEWSMGRTGILTPIALFKPIDIDGSTIERASLHNYSVLLETLHGSGWEGQKIQVFKANQIIPQIAEAEEDNDGKSKMFFTLPILCPCCHHNISIVTSDAGVKNLVCDNPLCEGKLINRLDHFCGKKGMDIKGLSKKTLEKLIDLGWLTCLSDIIDLQDHATEWKQLPGFGEKSVDNIIDAIDDRFANASLIGFISGLGIPLIGHRVSQQICEKINSWEEFRHLIDANFDFSIWDGFGYEMNKSLHEFDYSEADEIIESLTIKVETPQDKNVKLDGKIFVITGKLIYHSNRQQLVDKIEAAGGKVSSAVSAKTNYLVNNDIQSTSAKNKKALELKVPIITEEELMEMLENE